MGTDSTMRGYSDRIYMAMTDQERIAGQTYTNKEGNTVETKVSYAIPMEIIYLTPLTNWNPYKIEYEDDQKVNSLFLLNSGSFTLHFALHVFAYC